MATKGTRAPTKRKGNVPDYQYPIPAVPVDSDRIPQQDWESIMGWIAACVLFILLLPLNAMLLLDVLEAKHEVKAQVEKVEKLRRDVERSKRDKDRSNISDNPVFDRVRRPVQVSVPRPTELGKTRM